MKAAVVLGLGQSPAYADFPDPEPAEGAHLISVTASAITPLARSRAAGAHYSSENTFHFVAGMDGVGRLADGSRVYFLLPKPPDGGFAERTLAPSAQCQPLPDGLDDVTAEALANPGMSSSAAFARAGLGTGETVLVNGATGAAGRLAVQIAKRLGAKKVIATGRNLALLEALGADATIPLVADSEAQETLFRDAFADGVDVVVDYLWGRSAEGLLAAASKVGARRRLRFVQVGSASGGEINLPSAVLRSIPIELMGSGLGSVPYERLMASLAEVFRMAESGGLSLATRTLPLSDFAAAWALDDSATRTVLTMGAQ